jgi:hypothetical protein
MSKNKNKPKKNAAAAEPVSQEAGTTEVIAGPGVVATPMDTPPAIVPADTVPTAPADVPTDPVSTPADTTAEVEKTVAVDQPATEPAKESVVTPAQQPQQPPRQGFFAYLRSFFISDVGAAIHR